MSDKFPVDCLFFIFEQDFELYRGGGVDGSADSIGTRTATLGKSSSSASPAVPDPRGRKRKESSERNQVYDRSAASDMVKIVNAASRKGVGDLVWLGYNPTSKSGKSWAAPRVKFGTQLMCINAIAAERIHFVMGKSAPWKANHIDMWLLKWCHDHRFSKGSCSYVFPPLGCFGTHTSECCPDKNVRKHLWDEDYTAEGTRPSEDMKGHRSKDVYGMSQGGTGYVDLRCSLKEDYFAGDTGIWRTYIDLPDKPAKEETECVGRRRRRENKMLSLRLKAESESTVSRVKNMGSGFVPLFKTRTFTSPKEPSWQPLLRTCSGDASVWNMLVKDPECFRQMLRPKIIVCLGDFLGFPLSQHWVDRSTLEPPLRVMASVYLVVNLMMVWNYHGVAVAL